MKNFYLLVGMATLAIIFSCTIIPAADHDIPVITPVVSGKIQGQYSLQGKSFELKQVYVSKENSSFGKYGIVILLTDRPLPESATQDEISALWLGDINSVRLTFSPPLKRQEDVSQITTVFTHVFSKALGIQGSNSKNFEVGDFSVIQLDDQKIVAKIGIKAHDESLQATIDAPIRTTPTALTPQQLAEIQKSAIGQVIEAFIVAVRSGNKQAVKQTVTKASQTELDKPDADEGLKSLKEVLSPTMQLTELRHLQSGLIRIVMTDKTTGISSKGLSVLQEDGIWKVALVQRK